MKHTDITATILEKAEVAPRHVWMRLSCSWGSAEPGQFLHLWLPSTDDPLLRRPYTIYRLREGEMEILFQVVGQGSALLAERNVGDTVTMLGPLGEGFHLPPKDATALVVGGGVGMASLYLLVERLVAEGIETRVLLGSRRADYVLCRDDLAELGVALEVATDDGSEGYHGFVTDLTARVLDDDRPTNPRIYACGPTPMMRALTKIALDRDVQTEVALENRMGCAMGVCLGCVVPIRHGEGREYQRVCKEGPVFNARDVIWEYRI
ncbi:MAG: dihydroorotate dehydrogenase electron transfer subunit [Candidatus Poribacteria bacterium]|nr:dihydroorotate dehydrogenase electron transfer subunit [Candidatus Poribacteria bacterium]